MLHVDELSTRLKAGEMPPLTHTEIPTKFDLTKHLRTPAGKTNKLSDFGYEIPTSGASSGIATTTDDRFPFKWRGQTHYNKLTQALIGDVQKRMVENGLQKVDLEEDGTHIFVSPDYDVNTTGCLLIIQGSGAVRAGMWANSVAINSSIDAGTILTTVKWARSIGWAVIVFNPNAPKSFAGPDSCTAHTIQVFDKFVAPSKAASGRKVVAIAHSNGGRCVVGLLQQRTMKVLSSLAAVAFTDAVHWQTASPFTMSDSMRTFLRERTVDWVASKEPLDTKLRYACEEKNFAAAFSNYCTPYRGHGRGDPIPIRSAGHEKHVWTTACALGSVKKFLEAAL